MALVYKLYLKLITYLQELTPVELTLTHQVERCHLPDLHNYSYCFDCKIYHYLDCHIHYRYNSEFRKCLKID